MNNNPLILVFVKELNSTVRIETAALSLGMNVEVIETANQIAPSDGRSLTPQTAEHLWGRGAALLEKIGPDPTHPRGAAGEAGLSLNWRITATSRARPT